VSTGRPELVGEWCPQMFGDASGVKLGAFCSSEPDAASDVAAIRTRAVYDEAGGEWVLNGVKSWRLTAASPTCTRRVRELASSGWIRSALEEAAIGPHTPRVPTQHGRPGTRSRP
jgi:hypothetical protein